MCARKRLDEGISLFATALTEVEFWYNRDLAGDIGGKPAGVLFQSMVLLRSQVKTRKKRGSRSSFVVDQQILVCTSCESASCHWPKRVQR